MLTLHELLKRKRKNTLKTINPSKQAEVRYREDLFKIINTLKKSLQDEIKDFINKNPNVSDAELFNFITALIEKQRKIDILKVASLISLGVVNNVSRSNEKQLLGSLNIDPKKPAPNLFSNEKVKDKIDEYISKNVSLITSVKQDMLSDIEKVVRKNYFENGLVKNLSSTIQNSANTSKSRARLIARDQTNKLNADLTKDRQKSLGIDIYKWQTSRDERVRHTHKNMHGVLCKYSDESVYSKDNGKTWIKRTTDMPKGKPGDEIQCRCQAIAILGEF